MSFNGVLCASVLVDDRRCDRAATPEGWYIDGRGHAVSWGPLTACGSAALLVNAAEPGYYRLIDGGGNETMRIDKPYAPKRYRAVSLAGVTLARRAADRDGNGATIAAVMTAIRYEWRVEKPDGGEDA